MRKQSGANVLVLLAHNDDEYFVALRIGEEVRLGSRVWVAYLTHGSIYGADSKVRIEESARALRGLGASHSDMLTIGYQADIFDLKLHERMADAYEGLCAALDTIRIERLYVPAWEGGHPDHDAAHLIGVAFARERNLAERLYEFPAYNRFHVMKFIDDAGTTLATSPDRLRAMKVFFSAWNYKTQRRTFLGLLPASLVRLLWSARQSYRPAPADRDYSKPPHAGELFYEKRFGLSFDQFIAHAKSFYPSPSCGGMRESAQKS
ncbi:MAG: PIG-L deacetylase family protein [Gammaproteobacteria bacterium]